MFFRRVSRQDAKESKGRKEELDPPLRPLLSLASLRETSLHDFKLKVEFLTSADRRQIELPKLSREPKRRPALIHVHDKLDPQRAPEIRETHVRRQRLEFRRSIKRERRA